MGVPRACVFRVAKGPKLISVTHIQLYWALAIVITSGLVGVGVLWAVRGRVQKVRAEAPRANAALPESDAITGLMTRVAFETELAHALDTERGADRTGALLYAGLDGFRTARERDSRQASQKGADQAISNHAARVLGPGEASC